MICCLIMFLHNLIKTFNGTGFIVDESALWTAAAMEGIVEIPLLVTLADRPKKEIIITWGKNKK